MYKRNNAYSIGYNVIVNVIVIDNAAQHLLNGYKNPFLGIINMKQNKRKQVLDIRERFILIIKTIIFHGRQNFEGL